MRIDHLRSKDLNLLVVLAALLDERNATRAARRLGQTQSATSRALQRLRDLLGDPLFVRGPGGLVPTARAEALADGVRRVLEGAGDILEAVTFEASAAQRAFVMGMADLAEPWLMPRLVVSVAAQAPGIDLASFAEARPLEEGLASGRFDLVVVPSPAEHANVRRQALIAEDFACLLRRDHPALSQPWSAKRFAALGHVLVSPRGSGGGVVDRMLAEQGLTRRVVVRVGSFGSAPEVVAATDLVTTLPRSLALSALERLPLVLREPPLAVPGFTLYQCWHERLHADPGHAWLRAQVQAIAAEEARKRKKRRSLSKSS